MTMDWLADNPIANMYGPHFLLLYAAVNVITLVACWLQLRTLAQTHFPRDTPFGANHAAGVERAAWRTRLVGAVIIAGLGGYKLVVAISRGRYNVMFLILMGIISLVILVSMCPSRNERTGE
jgi:hypothetical protein